MCAQENVSGADLQKMYLILNLMHISFDAECDTVLVQSFEGRIFYKFMIYF